MRLKIFLCIVVTSIRMTMPSDRGLEGYALSLHELEQLKQINPLHLHDREREIQQALFWYQTIPTTGLRVDPDVFPPKYPFLPHFFTLWELAPSKGRGASVALIDTGVAAFNAPHRKEFRKNQDLEHYQDSDKNLNITVNNDIKALVIYVQRFLKSPVSDEKTQSEIVSWIQQLLKEQRSPRFEKFLRNHGHESLFSSPARTVLSRQGTFIRLRINKFIQEHFSLIDLGSPYKGHVVAQFLPSAKIIDNAGAFVAGHGSHAFGLIAGKLDPDTGNTPDADIGICGIAPYASVTMIKAFDEQGLSNKTALIEAVRTAAQHKVDVVNLSLKIAAQVHESEPTIKELNDLLGSIPYVVAAAGNAERNNQKNKLAYPARLSNVDIDVGAFSYAADGSYPVVPCSQYEANVGPRILAPGFNMLSCGLVPHQENDSMYVFMSGTSSAAAIMSGFVALALGEFKHVFTREQLLTVFFSSTVQLHADPAWRSRSLLGVIDMRTALFTLHVLKRLKDHYGPAFDASFNNLVAATQRVLFAGADDFSQRFLDGTSLRTSFSNFVQQAYTVSPKAWQRSYFIPRGHYALEQTITHVLTTVLASMQPNTREYNHANSLTGRIHRKHDYDNSAHAIRIHGNRANDDRMHDNRVFEKTAVDLFAALSEQAKKRLLRPKEVKVL